MKQNKRSKNVREGKVTIGISQKPIHPSGFS